MLLPALSKAKALQTRCLSNLRQIDVAAVMYAMDNADKICYSLAMTERYGYASPVFQSAANAWRGYLGLNITAQTNIFTVCTGVKALLPTMDKPSAAGNRNIPLLPPESGGWDTAMKTMADSKRPSDTCLVMDAGSWTGTIFFDMVDGEGLHPATASRGGKDYYQSPKASAYGCSYYRDGRGAAVYFDGHSDAHKPDENGTAQKRIPMLKPANGQRANGTNSGWARTVRIEHLCQLYRSEFQLQAMRTGDYPAKLAWNPVGQPYARQGGCGFRPAVELVAYDICQMSGDWLE